MAALEYQADPAVGQGHRIEDLRAELDGELLALGNPGYDDAGMVLLKGVDRHPLTVTAVVPAGRLGSHQDPRLPLHASDTPHWEANFKVLKYRPEFRERLDDIAQRPRRTAARSRTGTTTTTGTQGSG